MTFSFNLTLLSQNPTFSSKEILKIDTNLQIQFFLYFDLIPVKLHLFFTRNVTTLA